MQSYSEPDVLLKKTDKRKIFGSLGKFWQGIYKRGGNEGCFVIKNKSHKKSEEDIYIYIYISVHIIKMKSTVLLGELK